MQIDVMKSYTSAELTAMNLTKEDIDTLKLQIICPLTFKLTDGNAAVNYDISPTKIELPDGTKVFGWRSSPQKRSHTELFNSGLEQLKKERKIPEAWKGFFFVHEMGTRARLAYEDRVLSGKTKAHRRSWGPNEVKQGEKDKSRFHWLVTKDLAEKHNLEFPVTFEALEKKYPELYGKKAERATATAAEPEAAMPAAAMDALDIESDDAFPPATPTVGEIAQEASIVADLDAADVAAAGEEVALVETDSDADILEVEGPSDQEVEAEVEFAEEAVAASTDVADIERTVADELDSDAMITLPGSGSGKSAATTVPTTPSSSSHFDESDRQIVEFSEKKADIQTITSDVVSWRGSGGSIETRYLVYIGRLEREEWLPEGTTVLDGEDIEVRVKRA